MDEEALRQEAASKRDDPRHTYALKLWLRGEMQAVYSRHLPAEQVKAVLDEVWPVVGP